MFCPLSTKHDQRNIACKLQEGSAGSGTENGGSVRSKELETSKCAVYSL